jgi:hypothetical protein
MRGAYSDKKGGLHKIYKAIAPAGALRRWFFLGRVQVNVYSYFFRKTFNFHNFLLSGSRGGYVPKLLKPLFSPPLLAGEKDITN